MPKDLLFKYAGQYFCTVEESVFSLLAQGRPGQISELYESKGSMQTLALLLQPALGTTLSIILLVRLKVFQGVLLLLICLLNKLSFRGGGPLLFCFPILCQPLCNSLVVRSLVFTESICGLLPLESGIRVLWAVAVSMGESAEAAIF